MGNFNYIRNKINQTEILMCGYKDFTGQFDINLYEQINDILPETYTLIKIDLVPVVIKRISGLTILYINSSSIQINVGNYLDDNYLINLNQSISVSLNSSGAGGLDTGIKENNKWYYVWLIANINDVNNHIVSAIFSLSRTSPIIPSGYYLKRFIPIAIRTNNSGNIIPFSITSGWPETPSIQFNTTFDGNTSNPTYLFNGNVGTSFNTLDCSAFVPPISDRTSLYIQTGGQLKIRSNETDMNIIQAGSLGDGGLLAGSPTLNLPSISCILTSTQTLQYADNANTTAFIAVKGFIVNKV